MFNKYTLVYLEPGGRRKQGFLADPSRLSDDQLPYLKSRSRLAEVVFLEGGRLGRWIPDPSRLGDDQRPYLRSRDRGAEAWQDPGGRNPNPPRWIPDASNLNNDQTSYLKGRSRLAEVVFLEGERKGRWIPDPSILGSNDQIPYLRSRSRVWESPIPDSGRQWGLGFIWAGPAPIIDDCSWKRRDRTYVHILEPDRLRFCYWIPDASSLGGDQLSYFRTRSRLAEVLYDPGNRAGRWEPDPSFLGNDQVAWIRPPARNQEVNFAEGRRGPWNDGWYTQTINPPPGNNVQMLPLTGAGPC